MTRDVYVYPNPVTHDLNVSISGFEKGKVKLMILDDSGRQLLSDHVLISEDHMDLSFPEVNAFESGVYLLALQDADHLDTRQFVKI